MRKLTIGMRTVNVSQRQWNPSRSASHYNLPAVDLCGEDRGIDRWRAMDGAYKCIGGTYNSWGTAFIPVTPDGKPEMVELADGTQGYFGLFLVHSNISYKKGTIYPQGSTMYYEGTYKNQTGNHIHAEVFRYNPKRPTVPKRESVPDNRYNTYRFTEASYIDPSELWIITDYSRVFNCENMGQSFGRCTLQEARG